MKATLTRKSTIRRDYKVTVVGDWNDGDMLTSVTYVQEKNIDDLDFVAVVIDYYSHRNFIEKSTNYRMGDDMYEPFEYYLDHILKLKQHEEVKVDDFTEFAEFVADNCFGFLPYNSNDCLGIHTIHSVTIERDGETYNISADRQTIIDIIVGEAKKMKS